jgi:hypothetical protein
MPAATDPAGMPAAWTTFELTIGQLERGTFGHAYRTHLVSAEATRRACTQEDDWRRRRARWQAATDSAERLLVSLLSPAQRDTYQRHGYFDVLSSRGRPWRIMANGQISNVIMLDDAGRRGLAAACSHPLDVPDPAAWLAQALILMRDEDEFLASAHVGWYDPVPPLYYAP